MSVLALIPARSGSKGCKNKNFRQLGGKPLWRLALDCADAAGCDLLRVTSGWDTEFWNVPDQTGKYGIIRRPDELCSDTASMLSVVQHALEQIPGPSEQVVVLLQPTQPFRTPEHVRKAITLLQETGADSVVSVVPVPLTHSPEFQCVINSGVIIRSDAGKLEPYPVHEHYDETRMYVRDQPRRRQDVEQTYVRDGTVYTFRRSTVTRYDLYGSHVRPLILDPSESCELDTEANWQAVEARWNAR